ncbi:Hsp20/alpha crystallin family protein [Acaryochloris marina]|uniref:Hsp20/alpha crystallin family protein n=1 Tax=Acaryochloris marina TaxID=155978 RepID=UPI0021C2F11D|nr:Hsp20/alpha crystallin family protein [Acaryochloris marina]BDM83722.1 molecular chaperone [Acaryochloris marina MBIC10699]
MIIRYWNPIEETEAFRHQLDRIFDEMVQGDPTPPNRSWTPNIELWDEGNHLIYKVFLPGVKADDLEIQATRESIAISGQRPLEKAAEGTRLIYSDINYGSFHRTIKLPVAIQNTEVSASFNQGILTLTLPKVETEQNKVVKVSLTGQSESFQPALDASSESVSESVQ